MAEVYGLEHLKEKVQSYIQSNIQTLSRMDVYRQLPEEDVFEALSSDTLQVVSENEVYEAALHYHYSPEEVETDQVYLQVSPKVRLDFNIYITFFLFNISLENDHFWPFDSKANLRMLDAVRFSLIEKQVLQRLHSRLSPCPLKDSVSAALRYHEQELLQPVLQSPLTQPRSTFHCILGFGGMYSSSSYVETDHVFQLFHPSWSEWRTLKASHAPRMSNQGIAVLNNFVYLIGGDKNSSGFRAESRCWRSGRIFFSLF